MTWCNFPPYTQKKTEKGRFNLSIPFEGLFNVIIQDMFEKCHVSTGLNITIENTTEVEEPLNLQTNFEPNKELPENRMSLLLPYSRPVAVEVKMQHKEYFFLPLVLSPGAMHFYKRQADPVGSDLLTVIIQGWPMLILILLGAAYSGIIIWLLVWHLSIIKG